MEPIHNSNDYNDAGDSHNNQLLPNTSHSSFLINLFLKIDSFAVFARYTYRKILINLVFV